MFELKIDATHATARLEAMGPKARQAIVEVLEPRAEAIAADARARALAHFHSLGLKPGQYLGSIYGGVSAKETRVTAFVRSSSPLAHLLEWGFTITDLMIFAKADGIMAFDGGAGTVFAKAVHRHATEVQPYPAIYPAFEDAKSDIVADMTESVRRAVEAR